MKSNKIVIIGVALILCAVVVFILASKNLSSKTQGIKTQEVENMSENQVNMGGNSGPGQFQGGKGGFDLSTIDYATAAQKLNLTEEVLKTAMTVESGQRLNLENVATTLGVNIADLRTALGIPEMGPPKAGSAMPSSAMPSGTQN